MNGNTSGIIGSVIEVNSEKIIIEISSSIKNYSFVHNGLLYRIGQIGSFIKIISGLSLVYGMIESFSTFMQKDDQYLDKKILTVVLVGYRNTAGVFERGSKITPSINDDVYVIEKEDIEIIFKSSVPFPIQVGNNFYDEGLPVYLNLNEFVLKHSFIVGSTGSGKSNTASYLLENIVKNYKSSRILIIDVHGEYMNYLKGNAVEYSIYNKTNRLIVPYWMLSFETLCKLFGISSDVNIVSTVTEEFRDMILKMKKDYVIKNQLAEKIKLNDIDINSPIPFSINDIWYEFYSRGYGTYNTASREQGDYSYRKDEQRNPLIGDPIKMEKPQFEPYTVGTAAPYKSQELCFRSIADNMFKILKNDSFDFMFGNCALQKMDDINKLIISWIDNAKQITILNLSGIPHQVLDIVIGIIVDLTFDTIYYSIKAKKQYEGRPILMCFEEAHRYLNSKNDSCYSEKAIERVMKEGRKFGIGSMIISQRPAEISNTVISQVSTYIALRLTNTEDQTKIISFAPNNFSFFLKALSSLGTGEAFVIGESLKIPMKVKIPLLDSVKNVDFDKHISVWQEQRQQNPNYLETIEQWMQK